MRPNFREEINRRRDDIARCEDEIAKVEALAPPGGRKDFVVSGLRESIEIQRQVIAELEKRLAKRS